MTQGEARRTVPLWQFLVSIGGLSLVFALVVVAIVKIDQRDEREDDQKELDLNYLSCLRGNELRDLMILQTEMAYSSGAVLDFTAVPSFSTLPAETRQFFTDLADISRVAREAAATNPAHPKNSILTEIRKQLRDCEAEWPAHTPGLVLPHQKEPGT